MTAWRDALMESWSEGGRNEWPCEVVINDGHVSVTYKVEVGYDHYEGQESEPGHFVLACRHTSGRGTLHMFQGSKVLEGFWTEAGLRGMWRITLEV